MAELAFQDRPQPALLDRLMDNEPDTKSEPIENRILSKKKLRQAVLRDLAWLLNATNLAHGVEFIELPYAEHSVINYGVPALSGQIISTVEITQLENAIKQAIIKYEPRIMPESLQVEAIVSELQLNHHNLINIQIRGDLWAQPTPVELLLRTEIDRETGKVEINDLANSVVTQERG